jgi:hypothetical protein
MQVAWRRPLLSISDHAGVGFRVASVGDSVPIQLSLNEQTLPIIPRSFSFRVGVYRKINSSLRVLPKRAHTVVQHPYGTFKAVSGEQRRPVV